MSEIPCIFPREAFAVRAARFAVCDRKFPAPYAGNSSKQTSADLASASQMSLAHSSNVPWVNFPGQLQDAVEGGRPLAAQHSHRDAGFLALSRPSRNAPEEARKWVTKWWSFCGTSFERRSLSTAACDFSPFISMGHFLGSHCGWPRDQATIKKAGCSRSEWIAVCFWHEADLPTEPRCLLLAEDGALCMIGTPYLDRTVPKACDQPRSARP